MPLVDGDRVVVVGGGPAGSFFALHCLRFAAQARLNLEVIIYEPRNFDRPGSGGCNKCAGIISPTLMRNLEGFGLRLPPDLIQSQLRAYVLHTSYCDLVVRPPDPARSIASVFRGSGPRLGDPPAPRSFDGWLLARAQAQGATVRHEVVRSIVPGPRAQVRAANDPVEADLVVLATGVNSHAPMDPAWGYHPPRSEAMAQDEVLRLEQISTDKVHIYFDGVPGLVFGSLVPKGRYVNVSLLGRRLPRDAVSPFLASRDLALVFPDGPARKCGCVPRIAVSAAQGYYADHMVAVGDAAVTRLYKDGIGAAFVTAGAAARTAIRRGVAITDFAAGYAPTCRGIDADNRYGYLLFQLWRMIYRTPFMLRAWARAIQDEARSPAAGQVHRRMLWDMFTGDESYGQVFRLLFNGSTILGLWRSALNLGRQV